MNGFSVIFTDIHFLRVWPGSAKLEEDEQIHDQFQHRNKHILFTRGIAWNYNVINSQFLALGLVDERWFVCPTASLPGFPRRQIIPHQTCAQLRGRQQLFGEGPGLYKDESLSIDRTNPALVLTRFVMNDWILQNRFESWNFKSLDLQECRIEGNGRNTWGCSIFSHSFMSSLWVNVCLIWESSTAAWFLQSNFFQHATQTHTRTHAHTCGFTKGRSKFFLPALSLDSWILSPGTTHIPTLWNLPNCSLDVKNTFVFVFPNTNTEVFHEVLCLCLTHQCWLGVEVPGMFILKLKSWIHNCHPGVYSLGIPGWMGVLGMGMLLDIFQRFSKARW